VPKAKESEHQQKNKETIKNNNRQSLQMYIAEARMKLALDCNLILDNKVIQAT
jgi:hypothetical protein